MSDLTTDSELLARHANGDTQAFGELYERHRAKLWAAAARIAGPQDADDALQDGMLSAYSRASQFRGESAVSTWLYRIVVNAAYDITRRRPPVVEMVREPSYPPWRIRQVRRRLDIHKYLDRLPKQQQTALHLVDVMGYPIAEAAQIEGVAEGTMKSRVARARHTLADKLAMMRTTAA